MGRRARNRVIVWKGIVEGSVESGVGIERESVVEIFATESDPIERRIRWRRRLRAERKMGNGTGRAEITLDWTETP